MSEKADIQHKPTNVLELKPQEEIEMEAPAPVAIDGPVYDAIQNPRKSNLTPAVVLQMQRIQGNAYVSRLIQRSKAEQTAETTDTNQSGLPAFGGLLSISSAPVAIQRGKSRRGSTSSDDSSVIGSVSSRASSDVSSTAGSTSTGTTNSTVATESTNSTNSTNSTVETASNASTVETGRTSDDGSTVESSTTSDSDDLGTIPEDEDEEGLDIVCSAYGMEVLNDDGIFSVRSLDSGESWVPIDEKYPDIYFFEFGGNSWVFNSDTEDVNSLETSSSDVWFFEDKGSWYSYSQEEDTRKECEKMGAQGWAQKVAGDDGDVWYYLVDVIEEWQPAEHHKGFWFSRNDTPNGSDAYYYLADSEWREVDPDWRISKRDKKRKNEKEIALAWVDFYDAIELGEERLSQDDPLKFKEKEKETDEDIAGQMKTDMGEVETEVGGVDDTLKGAENPENMGDVGSNFGSAVIKAADRVKSVEKKYGLPYLAKIGMSIGKIKQAGPRVYALNKARKSDDVATKESAWFGFKKVLRKLAGAIFDLVITTAKLVFRVMTLMSGGASTVFSETAVFALGVASLAKSAFKNLRGVYKWFMGTKGVERNLHADTLVGRAQAGQKDAIMIIYKFSPFDGDGMIAKGKAKAKAAVVGPAVVIPKPKDKTAFESEIKNYTPEQIKELTNRVADALKSS